jgi:hypothetical protein
MRINVIEWQILRWLLDPIRSYTVSKEGRAYFLNTDGRRATREAERAAISLVKKHCVVPDKFGNHYLTPAGARLAAGEAPAAKPTPLPTLDKYERDFLRDMQRDEKRAPLKWYTPLMLGGSNSSEHSFTLRKLVLLGFVETKQRGRADATARTGRAAYPPPGLWRVARGSRAYRLTEAGRNAK